MLALLCLLLLAISVRPALAATQASLRTVVVLCDGLAPGSFDDARFPTLRSIARQGQVALMPAAVAGARTPQAAMIALAAGGPVAAKATDGQAFLSRSERVEGDPAGAVYARRMGSDPEAGRRGEVVVHLGWASIERRGLAHSLVGEVLARADRPMRVCGNADGPSPRRDAALLAVDERGVAAYGPIDTTDPARLAAWVAASPDSVAVQLPPGDVARLEAFAADLLQRAPAGSLRLLIVSPSPKPERDGRWRRMGPVVLLEPGAAPGLLTSDTTHTPGVVSNEDIAPTLLEWQGVAAPRTMLGRPIVGKAHTDALTAVERLDRVTRLGDQAMVPTFCTLGVIVGLIGFGGLVAVWRGRGARRFAFPLLVMLNMPTGLLIAAGLEQTVWAQQAAPLQSVAGLTVLILAAMVVCAGVATALGRIVPGPPIPVETRSVAGPAGEDGQPSPVPTQRTQSPRTPRASRLTPRASRLTPHASRLALHASRLTPHAYVLWSLALMWLAIIGDTVAGQPMQRLSLLSAFLPQAIRYYGVGNEYMGVLIGALLSWVFLARVPRAAAAPLFAGAALLIGYPRLGANAGGFVTAVVAFGIAWGVMRDGRVTWRRFVTSSVLGFAGAFALAWIDTATGGAETHMGAALHRAGSPSMWQIVLRKALMNARLTLNPGSLCTIAGYGLIVWLLRVPLRQRVAALGERFPGLLEAAPAVLCGSLAAYLYNDSGIVAAVLLTGVYLATGVYLLFVTSPARTAAADRKLP